MSCDVKNLWTLAALLAVFAPGPALADRGGPDRGGYEWVDSEEEGAEVGYEWIDVAESATEIVLEDDDESESIPLGFSFTFYGSTYTEVIVGSNGYLSFQHNSYSGVPGQCPLPEPDLPNNAIYAFYQDLNPEEPSSGTITYQTTGEEGARLFVVTYDEIDLYQGSPPFGTDPVTFQVVLYEGTNEIRVNVKHSGDLAGGPRWSDNTTIGVENDEGTSGVGLCPGRGGVPSRYSVLFRRSDGFGLFPPRQRGVGTPGEPTEFELELLNFSAEEGTARVEIDSASGWDAEPVRSSYTVAPGGEPTPIGIIVEVPDEMTAGDNDVLTVTVSVGEQELTAELEVVVTFPHSDWQFIQDLPEALKDVEVVSDGTYLYALGGSYLETGADGGGTWTPVATTWRWSPETNWWDDGAVADLPVTLTAGSACYLEGHIYYVGGFDGSAADESHWSFSPDIYIYDIAAGEWTAGSPPPHAVAQANVVCDETTGSVFVINGYADLDEDGDFIDRGDGGADTTEPHTLVYDASGDRWREAEPPDTGVTGAGVGIVGTRIIVAGGFFDDEDDPSSTGWVTRGTMVYDIVDDSWDDAGWLSAVRSRTAGVVFEGQLCVIGGSSAGELLDNWECFSDSIWIEQVDRLSFPRQSIGAAALADHLYVVGGDTDEWVTDRSERWPSAEIPAPTPPEGDGDADADADGDADGDGDIDADADADGDGDGGGDDDDDDDDDGGGCRVAGGAQLGGGARSAALLIVAVLLGRTWRRRR